MTRLAATTLIGLALAGAACPKGDEVAKTRPPKSTVPPAPRSAALPLPRDPDIAVQEELDLARRRGTVAAYDLFLVRHGEHRLARTARRERARIVARARQAPPPKNR